MNSVGVERWRGGPALLSRLFASIHRPRSQPSCGAVHRGGSARWLDEASEFVLCEHSEHPEQTAHWDCFVKLSGMVRSQHRSILVL